MHYKFCCTSNPASLCNTLASGYEGRVLLIGWTPRMRQAKTLVQVSSNNLVSVWARKLAFVEE